MEYSIIIEKNPETGWYCGQCKQLPEALSQGQTLDELMTNIFTFMASSFNFAKIETKTMSVNT